MTSENLVTVPVGTTLDQAREMFHHHKVEKLLVVDSDFRLKGLITVKDIQKLRQVSRTRARTRSAACASGAAIGVSKDTMERAAALVARARRRARHRHGARPLAGRARHGREACASAIRTCDSSPATSRPRGATAALIDRGVDAVKVGIGAGSICTTRVVAGIGVPMITAIADCARAALERDVPIIADGGIRYSGDITKALAVGASAIMIGSLFAGTDESPGEIILFQGRSFKEYRGMGSIGAMRRGSRDRYFQDEFDLEDAATAPRSSCPKASRAASPTRAASPAMIHQLVGGLRAGMGYCGCADIRTLQRDAQLIRVTSAGVREGHVHDVIITKEAPNYRVERR